MTSSLSLAGGFLVVATEAAARPLQSLLLHRRVLHELQ